MANYIISFDSAPMKQFQKRLSILDDAAWIREKKNIAEIKSTDSGTPFFFVYMSNERDKVDDLVLEIRDKLPQAKVIYILSNGKLQDQKSHQMTPVGGDVYLPLQIETDKLYSILGDLIPIEMNHHGNQLENTRIGSIDISAETEIENLKNNSKNKEIEKIFSQFFPEKKSKKPAWQSTANLVAEKPQEEEIVLGDDMSDKDHELSLDNLGELELSENGAQEASSVDEVGLDLDIDESQGFDLSVQDGDSEEDIENESGMGMEIEDALTLDTDDTFNLGEAEESSLDEDFNFSLDESTDSSESLEELNLEDEAPSQDRLNDSLTLSGQNLLDLDEELGTRIGNFNLAEEPLSETHDEIDFSAGQETNDADLLGVDISDDAREKLKEIDAIMDHDLTISKVFASEEDNLNNDAIGFELDDESSLEVEEVAVDSDIDIPLVSDDLDLASLDFAIEEEQTQVKEEKTIIREEKNKKKPKEIKEEKVSYDGNIGKELQQISGAYSGEMERWQATISNLRADREELLTKIQNLEEQRVLQNRQSLTMRAELDEKKIELSIIRKKLNDEIAELKDRMRLHDEKKMILEEKNKILMMEVDKATQKNKIDVKKIQMRERELEQKLELLKADSETQIRHRDLKILELKRKLDGMEFDMESITVQEKRSVESRFELEDKLDKAIKTLRSAISVLEDESEKNNALEALKKNIDM